MKQKNRKSRSPPTHNIVIKKKKIIVKQHKYLIINVLLPLFLGLSIYLFLRNVKILIVSKYIKIPNFNFSNHQIIRTIQKYDFVIYNLPDALWLYSLLSFILIIWKNKKSKQKWFWFSIASLIALCLEIGQKYHLVIGTFDILDIMSFILIILILIYKNL